MARTFKFRDRKLVLGEKTYIMGILNATPDSFSDGGKYMNPSQALKHVEEMIRDGADIIDVGGESTRPGHKNVEENEEMNRICGIISSIRSNFDIPISVDTQKANVAREALVCGADIINDIWGLQGDRDMAKVAKDFNCGIIAMHNKDNTDYVDLVSEIRSFFEKTYEIAQQNGIEKERLCFDPGIGFGKTLEQNVQTLKELKKLYVNECPMLLGTSRKSFIGKILGTEVDKRLEGSLATVAIGIADGVDFVRVHDVKETKRVAVICDKIKRG